MFDLVVGNVSRPFRERAVVPTMISVAGHGVVVLVLVVLPLVLAANHLPVVPTMMAFVAAAPPAPPPAPPPPPPPASTTKRTPPRPEAVSTAGAISFPVDAPSEIRPEPMGEGSEGVEGGVEGGIVGGTIGGIVGGLTDAPPPPPPPPPLPPAAPAAPVRIGGEIRAPALIHRVEPVYPPLAAMAQVGGMVILEAVVDVEGRVESVRVLRSVKFLDGAAIDAVKQWRYSPLVLNRIPTPFVLTVTLSFAIARR